MKGATASHALAALSLLAGGRAQNSSTENLDAAAVIDAFTAPKPPLLANGYVDLGIAAEAFAKAQAHVATLSNAQKIKVITGRSVTGNTTWKALEGKDGVMGINMQMYVTGFPMINAATMTWNPDLVEIQHRATGDEFYAMGYNLIAGPVASPLGRDPYGGRLNEGYSPDPYLSGIMMGKAISGMNSAGVVATGRHYLLNEQETNRMNGGYSSNADNKTLHEVYLWPFADAVNNGMMSVMCAMNKVNDVRSCENHWILNGYLKTDLGFPGLVHPDVGSQVTAYNSFNAGLDLGSSQYWSESVIEKGLSEGKITQNRLDDMAIRNMMGYYYVGLDNGEQPEPASTDEYRDVRGNHSIITRQVAQEAIILLKNDNTNGGGLPLNKPRALSLFGAHAGPCTAGPNYAFSVGGTPAQIYQGHLATGGGSGQASFPYLIAPSVPLTIRAANDGGMIWWITNDTYTAPAGGGFGGGGGGFPGGGAGGNSTTVLPTGDVTNNTFAPPGGGGGGGGFGGGTAVTPSVENYSENSDACIVFMNSWSGEGADRTELSNDGQDALVNSVADNCNNTIVVGNFAGPRVLDAWIEHPNVRAVLYSGLLGQESGNAIADVLHGDINPSGKLTHTIAMNASDYPTPTCETTQCNFTEGVYLDYRYFDSNNIPVRYPFGHGLSYTTFSYGDVTAKVTNQTALDSTYPTGGLALGGPSDLFLEVATVQTTVQNNGTVDGAEVAQLYVSFPAEAQQPVRVLRGFSKLNLTAGDSAQATFSLRRRDLSYWDDAAYAWAIAKGDYTFSVGSSLEDIRGTTTLTI